MHRFILFSFILFYLICLHFILFHFTLAYFSYLIFYFISFYLVYLTLFHSILPISRLPTFLINCDICTNRKWNYQHVSNTKNFPRSITISMFFARCWMTVTPYLHHLGRLQACWSITPKPMSEARGWTNQHRHIWQLYM